VANMGSYKKERERERELTSLTKILIIILASTNETEVSFFDGVRNTGALKHRKKDRQINRNIERNTEGQKVRNTYAKRDRNTKR
jgi:hypothetical protein